MSEANVIDRVCGAVKKASTAIVLTHNINFLFIESILLPRLRDVGSPHLTIFADAACATNSYQTERKLISKLGTRYRVVSVDLGNGRRFHPKALFLAGEDNAMLAVGSGNLTHGGWSANHEIWRDYSALESGGSRIAAFRDYLEAILNLVPDPSELRRNTIDVFSDDMSAWAANLPEAAGLAYTPNDTSLLEQIRQRASENIHSIDVLSPYFDDQALALGEVAKISKGDVRVWLQPKRAGLSQEAANKLAANIQLLGVSPSGERSTRFLHAKAYMLKTNAETILVSGSANCSQAALLATRDWGNAELVTIEAIDGSEEGDFWDGLQKLDKSVELPQSAPSTEWESFEEPDIRILSARKDGDTLRVHYKAKQVPKQIFVTLNGNEKNILASEQADGLAVFDVSAKATTLILHAVFDEGVHVGSNPSWIDDEQSLRTDGPERRIREKLEDMSARGSSSTRDFFDLFNLYDGHIRKPVAFGRRNSGLLPTENTSIVEFSEDEVFSDGFATPPPLSGDRGVTATGPVDTFTVFVAFFNTKSQSPPPRRSLNQSPAQIPETENEDAPPSEVQDVVATEPDEQVQRKFTRALASIERGMSQKDFVTSRPPERLSSDLGLWALLLVKARFHEHIRLNPEEFRNHILKVMRLLFLGNNNTYGSIREHLRSLPEDAAQQFSNAMASPKLTAALSLLFMLDWENSDTEARELRFAAARLGTLYPWLPRGGSKEEIFADIDQIALTILPDGYRTKLFSLWGQWIADSHALERFAESLKRHRQDELGDMCPDRQLLAGELCWQTNHEYCIVDENCFRRAKNKIALAAIDSGKSLSVQAHFVAPVSDLLKKPIIMVSDQVRQQVFSVLSGVGLSQEAVT